MPDLGFRVKHHVFLLVQLVHVCHNYPVDQLQLNRKILTSLNVILLTLRPRALAPVCFKLLMWLRMVDLEFTVLA